MTTTKKRVAAFDVLKGIAIYLVVMGHVLTMCIRDIDSAVLFKLVGEIHMPIFFFISGYFTYKLTGNGDFAMPNLRKRFWQLIIPFLAVSALWMWYFPHSRLQSPLSQSWPQLLTTYWKDGYWFTLTLFEVVLVYAGISRLMAAARRLWLQVAIPAAAYLALILVSSLISDPRRKLRPRRHRTAHTVFPGVYDGSVRPQIFRRVPPHGYTAVGCRSGCRGSVRHVVLFRIHVGVSCPTGMVPVCGATRAPRLADDRGVRSGLPQRR